MNVALENTGCAVGVTVGGMVGVLVGVCVGPEGVLVGVADDVVYSITSFGRWEDVLASDDL
jgi:hypothetical protein